MTTDEGTDLTGRENSYQRVERVKERYAAAVLKRCPGVTAIGISHVRVFEALDEAGVAQRPVERPALEDKDYVIGIHLLSERYRPERPQLLDGVRLEFFVSGPWRALAS